MALVGALVTVPATGNIPLVNATRPGSLVLITPANSAVVMIGDKNTSATQGIPIPASSTVSLPVVGGTGQLYLAGTSGDKIYYYYGTAI